MMSEGEQKSGVRVTTKAESTGVVDNLELNPWYFRTVPGVLKLVQLLFAIICMGCASPVVTSYTNFFMFVVAVYFVVTLVLCVVYFFGVKRLAPNFPWLLVELCATGGGSLLYFIVGVVQLAATNGSHYRPSLAHHRFYSAYVAAGCFGLFNFAAYSAGAFFLFMEWRLDRAPAAAVTIPENAAAAASRH